MKENMFAMNEWMKRQENLSRKTEHVNTNEMKIIEVEIYLRNFANWV